MGTPFAVMELPPEWLVAALVVVFLVVVRALRTARFKGLFGELRVRAAVNLRLDGHVYHSLHNLTLPTRDGTTQIDHIVVSKFGVFVVETKNLIGWVFGDERSKKWTQAIYGNQYQFLKPLRQNYRHLKAVQDLLSLGPECLHSVVVFVGDSQFKTTMPPNVLERGELAPYIRSKTDTLLTDRQVEKAVRTLKKARVPKLGAKRRHLQNLRANRRFPVCPRCGREMVLRTAKRGPDPGSQFWGCPGYPDCKGTRDIT